MEDFDLYATSLKGDRYLEQIDSVGGESSCYFGNEVLEYQKKYLIK